MNTFGHNFFYLILFDVADQPRWKMLTFCKTPDFKLRCYKKYGRVIEVVRVMHGKTNLGTCTKGNTATCESVLSKLRRQCDDTHICPIKPASFGLVDLCHDKSKYLKITYKCKIGNVVIKTYLFCRNVTFLGV